MGLIIRRRRPGVLKTVFGCVITAGTFAVTKTADYVKQRRNNQQQANEYPSTHSYEQTQQLPSQPQQQSLRVQSEFSQDFKSSGEEHFPIIEMDENVQCYQQSYQGGYQPLNY